MQNKQNSFSQKLYSIFQKSQILLNEPASKHTSFRIGGPIDYLVLPQSVGQIAAVLQLSTENGIPVTILGNGSNVLVRDKGIRGLVIKISHNMSQVTNTEEVITAGAGALLTFVSKYAADQSLTGMEFAVGIPGTLGGAVFMNAGAYDGEMSQIVEAVTAVSHTGVLHKLNRQELNFGYRNSIFQENHYIIAEVSLVLKNGDTEQIKNEMQECTKRRRMKQPIELPSAGSTFKRPPGYFAGTLIEQAGLKGFTIGGAQVSPKHAGFVVNVGGATANDVLTLIAEVQKKVYDQFGVKIQPEVRIIGE